MNEMIERAAKAIYESWANYPNCSVSKSWEEVCEKLPAMANDFRRKAKAVIKAMREPTEEMLLAGTDQPNHYRVWLSMIDEILK